MTLRIAFDEGVKRHICPGSVLSGNVELVAPTQQSLGEVSITFAGRCKVKITRSNGQTTSTYYSKGYYFSQREQLHKGDFTFQAGTYRWPFSFVVPEHADRRLIVSQRGKGDTFDPNPPWHGTGSEEHPLPPSFSGPTSAGSNGCSVEYYLKAELAPPALGGSLFSRTIDEKVMLHFQPSILAPGFDQSLHKHNRTFSVQTLKLLPEDSEERNSFRHKLKGIFASSSLPQLRLQVEVRIPRRVVAAPGAAFPCLVSVRTCGRGIDHERQVPQSSVLIRRFELELRSHTETRTRRHRDNKRRTEGLGAGSGAAIPIQRREDDDSGKPKLAPGTGEGGSTAATDVGALYRARMPADVTSDFSTYNIAHYHTLELKLRLECAGEGMKFDIGRLPLEITPQIAPQDPPAWEPSLGTGSISVEQHNDVVAPPSYVQGEESPGYQEGLEKAMPHGTDTWE